MTDWLDTYRTRQLAEADRLNAIDRMLAKSPWGRSAPLAPLFALIGDAAGIALLFGLLWAGLTFFG